MLLCYSSMSLADVSEVYVCARARPCMCVSVTNRMSLRRRYGLVWLNWIVYSSHAVQSAYEKKNPEKSLGFCACIAHNSRSLMSTTQMVVVNGSPFSVRNTHKCWHVAIQVKIWVARLSASGRSRRECAVQWEATAKPRDSNQMHLCSRVAISASGH